VSGSISGSNRHSNDRLQAINENEFSNVSPSHSIKNSVQVQIEKMFTDIAKDDPSISNSFLIKYLGSLPLTGKVTSLLGLQDPLRQLYLSGAGHGVSEIFHFPSINSKKSQLDQLQIEDESKNLPLIECHIVLFVNYTQLCMMCSRSRFVLDISEEVEK
jgi:hypothetical protein